MTRPPETVRSPRPDGEATRARILEAAGALFAERGFAQTPNKAIAARAQVDMASINYHFGSRGDLYQAVLTEAHRHVIDIAELQRLASARMPAAGKLRVLMHHVVRSAQDTSQRWHIPLLTAELLAPLAQMQTFFQGEIGRKAAFVVAILSEITGLPKDDPALLRGLISVIAPALMLQLGRRGIPGPLQTVLHMPADVLTDHLHQFALAGLRAIQAAAPTQ